MPLEEHKKNIVHFQKFHIVTKKFREITQKFFLTKHEISLQFSLREGQEY